MPCRGVTVILMADWRSFETESAWQKFCEKPGIRRAVDSIESTIVNDARMLFFAGIAAFQRVLKGSERSLADFLLQIEDEVLSAPKDGRLHAEWKRYARFSEEQLRAPAEAIEDARAIFYLGAQWHYNLVEYVMQRAPDTLEQAMRRVDDGLVAYGEYQQQSQRT